MRSIWLAGAAALAFAVLGAESATAQNYRASDAVSLSREGTMQCAEFTHLGKSEQARVVRRMIQSAPQQSLAAPTLSPRFGANGELRFPDTDSSAVTGTPLTSGQLVAACQAAPPRSTLREAFSGANSGPSFMLN